MWYSTQMDPTSCPLSLPGILYHNIGYTHIFHSPKLKSLQCSRFGFFSLGYCLNMALFLRGWPKFGIFLGGVYFSAHKIGQESAYLDDKTLQQQWEDHEHLSIPEICHFWYATIFFRPVKSTPKKCVNSRQKLPRDKQRKSIFYVELHTVCVKVRVYEITHCV